MASSGSSGAQGPSELPETIAKGADQQGSVMPEPDHPETLVDA